MTADEGKSIKIEKVNGKLIAAPLDNLDDKKEIKNDTLVSMNMFCFTKDIMERLEEGFVPFMEANKNNLAKCEYLIPTVVSDLIEAKKATVDVLETKATWYGVTYKEDKDFVVNSLKNLTNKGEYPKGLWK